MMSSNDVKRDCFGYKQLGNREKCIALKELYCKKEKCKFYKAMKEQDVYGKTEHE